MKDKDLYIQKMQAQVDIWKAELDKFNARASKLSANSQLDMNKNIKALETKIEEGKSKIQELAKAGEEVWDSALDAIQSRWESLKSEANEFAEKLKR